MSTRLAYLVDIHLLIIFPGFLKYKILPLQIKTRQVSSNRQSLQSRNILTSAGKF